MLRRSDDAFDTMVCALLARAVELGLTIHAGSGATSAESEGWIHLPVVESLQLLVSPPVLAPPNSQTRA